MTKAQRIQQAARRRGEHHREGGNRVQQAMAANRRLTGRAPFPVRTLSTLYYYLFLVRAF